MNILRLVVKEKEKKHQAPSAAYQKIEEEASCRDKGTPPIRFKKDELKESLTPVQYQVTQQKGTERAFSGKYVRSKEEGVYTCVICENPLFKSEHKYQSVCGWPAFSDVMVPGKVTLCKDFHHGMQRVEATCSQCGSHLGHVFDDGPKPERVRYCINSASLDFKKHTTV